jgi:hypothetical protein
MTIIHIKSKLFFYYILFTVTKQNTNIVILSCTLLPNTIVCVCVCIYIYIVLMSLDSNLSFIYNY